MLMIFKAKNNTYVFQSTIEKQLFFVSQLMKLPGKEGTPRIRRLNLFTYENYSILFYLYNQLKAM